MNSLHTLSIISSFPPIEDENAKLLILGSMPGKASLEAGQYYAHPRNLFWPIVGELTGAYPALEYTERTRILTGCGIAVWDVLKTCRRNGSLDAGIDKSSMVANDFPRFFAEHPHIERIFFNGATAEQTFRRHVLATLNIESVVLHRLPSTSPAHAALSYSQKLQSWRLILEDALPAS